MRIHRREAIRATGAAIAGLSFGIVKPGELLAQAAPQAAPPPDKLVQAQFRQTAVLPLKPDGSAVEYTPKEAGTVSEPSIWRYTRNQTPQIEFDYRKMKIKVDSRGTAKLTGTLSWSDLEPLPKFSYVVRLQCGAKDPSGIVKWTGVRFADFTKMLGVQKTAYYARFVASDGYFVEEDMTTLMHPQVVLAWMLNDEPLPPKHGAPLRLILPFRYAARSLKAITEIYFTATSFPAPKAPPA